VSQFFEEDAADDVPTLLPTQEEPLAPDDAFRRYEESLDERPDSVDLIVTEEPPTPVGRSWAYDFAGKTMLRTAGSSGPLVTHDDETLRQWIEHTLRVARGAHPIYSDDYGLDLPADFRSGPVSHFPLDEYERAVTDALTVHRAIEALEDFAFSYDPMQEYVAVDFTVVKASRDDTGNDLLRIEGARLG
jgi:hypothetical protein